MALRINTNIAAMSAHKSLLKTDMALSESLGRLSSGLRINKAADDSSGMAIADSLRSQALGLGQAIRNGNDGISIVQTADAALEESINIVNTIKQKAIQAAQDGQTTDSRKAIQADISKLRDNLDTIAKTTAFNNQKLLSGSFTDKKFQVGAYSGETVDISIGSSEATKIGHVSTANLTFADEGLAELSIYSNIQNATFNLNSVSVAYDNSSENSIGAVADAINLLSDKLGITADASVSTTTTSTVVAGTTGSTFAINDVLIGSISVSENDSTGSLVAVINQKSDQHGVVASVNQGFLTLTSSDDRSIKVTQDTDTTTVLGGTAAMSTLGTIALTQQGTADIVVSNRAGGTAVALLDNELVTAGTTTTTISSILASGSEIIAASTIGADSVLATGTVLEDTAADVSLTGTSILGSGSVVDSGSTIAAGSTLAGALTMSGTMTGTGTLGAGSALQCGTVLGAGTTLNVTGSVELFGDTAASTGTSTLTAGTLLDSGSTLGAGSVFLAADIASGNFATAANVTASGIWNRLTATTLITIGASYTLTADAIAASGSIMISGSQLYTGSTFGAATTIYDETTTADMTLTTGTVLNCGSILTNGTNVTASVITAIGSTYTLSSGGMTDLAAGSILASGTALASATSLSNSWVNADAIAVIGSMTLGAGSSLITGATLAEGSSIGGTVTLAADEIVDSLTDMRLAVGSTLATGSTISAGTFLTNDVVATDGVTYSAGRELTADIVTSGSTAIANMMTLNGGSTLTAGSTLAANANATDPSAVSSTSEAVAYRLSDISVTTQEGAQIAISVADAALKNLDKVRSDLGSVQNQLNSTIANISTTRINVASAESTIRDVDFAEESSTFTKMQILSQAGTFAMSQANASAQQVLSLLQ